MPAPIATPMRCALAGVTSMPESLMRVRGRAVPVVHERIHLAQLFRRQVLLRVEAGDARRGSAPGTR